MQRLDPEDTRVKYQTRLTYTDRPTKAAWIADKYREILSGHVLDVGCDQKHLAKHLPAGARYLGVDMGPPADVVVNLDRQELPFEARSFDTVLCADVLEHLDRLHDVFDRLCSIARGHVIIALPNPLRNMLLALHEGTKGVALKYYGLPLEPPPDRHRWFFGYEEAERFLRERGRRNGFAVEQVEPEERGVPALTNAKGVNVIDSPNATFGTIWCVLKRD